MVHRMTNTDCGCCCTSITVCKFFGGCLVVCVFVLITVCADWQLQAECRAFCLILYIDMKH
jgi:hypothetical protein